MKKLAISMALLFLAVILFNNCEKKDETPPTIPPQETMAVDFTLATKNAKSAEVLNTVDATQVNFGVSALTVAYWNLVLGVTLAVPVTAFYKSFQNTPTYLGNKSWQWGYTVTVFAANYNARLVGTVRQNDVKWEMFISKSGIGAFPEFLWFEGSSDLDGNGGQWILYESPTVNEQVLQIDWTKTNDVVGNVKYTYIRESSNGDPNQLSSGSYLNYGLQEGDYNAFYNIHYNNRSTEADPFKDVYIEWSTTEYFGHIKAESYFQNTDWHCWDGNGDDVACP